MTIGKLCFHHEPSCYWAQWEGAGWHVRFGGHLWSIFHVDYRRDKQEGGNPWPKWLRFCLVLRSSGFQEG